MANKYDPKTREPHWQSQWEEKGVYHFKDDQPKEKTFVIDTPPPTVSGVLHMGHIFSYTQADFVARYKRMNGFDVFYPMGFDDNGLPTERLVEKIKKIRAHNYISEHGREAFVELCQDVVDEAETEFKRLFQSVALSVDWNQLYQTISAEVTALSQASFLDLIDKDEAYRDFRPTYWDWKDQTAIATAETEEKEMPGWQCHIPFGLMDKADWEELASDPSAARPEFSSLEQVHIMTTRPELLGACLALMVHPDDEAAYKNKVAISPLFNVVVPIVADEKVDKEKGTGFVMCCSWGDDTDKEWIQEHHLPWRPLIGMDGKITILGTGRNNEKMGDANADSIIFRAGRDGKENNLSHIWERNCFDVKSALATFRVLEGTKLIRDIKNENSAKGRALKLLEDAGLLIEQGDDKELITKKAQTVKCAERSGAPIEIIPTYQWFVKIMDKKDALKDKAAQCDWNPEYMKVRLDQWADGLKEDWCISRQRFFGVPFPVWYAKRLYIQEELPDNIRSGIKTLDLLADAEKLYADISQLPVDPLDGMTLPKQLRLCTENELSEIQKEYDINTYVRTCFVKEPIYSLDGKILFDKEQFVALHGDKDVMDTWATSSISPNINAKSLTPNKLYPADIRPQAHEIIRTWAFYTIVKSHLHNNCIPWKHLMISGWCLASDKTKMSKSKGNVVTPVELIEDKGADAVRYWASTSRLGADTAFSEDLLKIGKKLVTKLYNASNFAGQHLTKIDLPSITAAEAMEQGIISETLDQWILSRLHVTIDKATKEFEHFEYAAAREAIEEFFWKDFCDNYLELVKARAYNEDGSMTEGQQSAVHTLHYCLNNILKLFAPFVPHICEELYSTLFAEESGKLGSIHGRDQWPNASKFGYNSDSETLGIACVELLEAVRKAKSESSVSIKYPVSRLRISAANYQQNINSLESILSDLKAAGTVEQVELMKNFDGGAQTEAGNFKVEITLAEQAATGS